jgi:hypothetical protein
MHSKTGDSRFLLDGDVPALLRLSKYELKMVLSLLHGFGYALHHGLSIGSPRYVVRITSFPVSCSAFKNCHQAGVQPSLYLRSIVDATIRSFIWFPEY